MPEKKRVLFLVPYPLHRAPSQRFRVELFLPILKQQGVNYRLRPFMDEATWEVLYKSGSPLQKVWGVVKGFIKRIKDVVFIVPQYDYIFIHREATPIGPPIVEFIVSKLWRKKIIYDFDDAIWIPNTTQENKIVNWVKAFWKVKYICKWSYKVVGGNDYLCQFAKQYNKNVVLIPTCVDTVNQHNQLKEQQTERVVIGWTGSHSTMKFLDEIIEVLSRITEEFNVDILIISNKAPQFTIKNLRFIPWQEATEVEDLLQMNIGVMPLEADPWCEGKCGFKLIQYMALGIPAVASPIGVNKQIIDEGQNGFLCNTKEEWYNTIALLIQDVEKRRLLGTKGQAKIKAQFSIQANAGAFVDLFN
ncbi:glycosyltransferase family 4 protein [Flavisolibacter tropicus]|uniref:Group 1 glycosyl transferase n=1 Tax=Flavisolibacter tropicus TaxID=1492898 RepID=A0A172TZN2_9BACT|nr:glycosyltransferase family 4 protein [Flavisolibacter tropicus]ANE52466.1 group 1 glycosyl transferase [Flavisolibacter tropicus]